MRIKHSISLMLSVMALLAFCLPGFAVSAMMNMGSMGNMDRIGDMMGMCIEHADKMGLTDDQIQKMKPAHLEMQKKQARFMADLKIAEIELMEIMEVKDFDLEKAGTAVKKISDIKTAHHLEMLKAMREVRPVLTDEQFRQMKKKMALSWGPNKPPQKMMKKRNKQRKENVQ